MNIGVDIGGTKIASALVDENGQVVASHQLPTGVADGVDAILDNIIASVSALNPPPDAPVGVGCAGVITDGIVRYAVNLGWRDFPLQAQLMARLGRRVVVENDVRAALIGEHRYGVARDVSDVVYMAIGTGLGVAALVDGAVLRGALGMALELGQIRLADGGIYEARASGSGLLQIGQALGMEAPNTHQILTAAQVGDALAMRVIKQLTDHIAMALVWTCAVLNPRMVILGGGMGLALERWLYPAVMTTLQTRSAPFITDALTVHMAHIHNNAVGAAALVTPSST